MQNRLVFLGLAVITIAACGGGGDSSGSSNPFGGTYNGSFSGSSGDHGTISLSVDPGNGSAGGSVFDQTYNAAGTVSGSMSNGGYLNVTVHFPGGNGYLVGNISKNSAGHYVGTLAETGTLNQNVSVDMVRG